MSGDRSSGQSERPTERPTERQAERPPASGRNSPEHTLEDDPVALALNRVRAAARAKGLRPGSPAAPAGSAAARRAAARRAAETPRSGAHPDGRDPQLLGSGIDRLVTDRGWQAPVAVGGVIGRWEAVVGAEIAAHCRPETFRDGVLSVRAESTTWATQLKLLVPTILSRLNEEVGEGVVERVVVQGPNAPSWRRGPWTASGGLGPRDTYG